MSRAFFPSVSDEHLPPCRPHHRRGEHLFPTIPSPTNRTSFSGVSPLTPRAEHLPQLFPDDYVSDEPSIFPDDSSPTSRASFSCDFLPQAEHLLQTLPRLCHRRADHLSPTTPSLTSRSFFSPTISSPTNRSSFLNAFLMTPSSTSRTSSQRFPDDFSPTKSLPPNRHHVFRISLGEEPTTEPAPSFSAILPVISLRQIAHRRADIIFPSVSLTTSLQQKTHCRSDIIFPMFATPTTITITIIPKSYDFIS
ncbi:hypothetical protein Rs2_29705 [Raphanus sativus]|nr:hypothetical protein Rs2_29705 [Raphanus sativus]